MRAKKTKKRKELPRGEKIEARKPLKSGEYVKFNTDNPMISSQRATPAPVAKGDLLPSYRF